MMLMIRTTSKIDVNTDSLASLAPQNTALKQYHLNSSMLFKLLPQHPILVISDMFLITIQNSANVSKYLLT